MLEARRAIRLEVRKLAPEEVEPARASLQAALEARGARVRGVRVRAAKGRLSFDVHVSRSVDPDELEDTLEVEPALKERISWDPSP